MNRHSPRIESVIQTTSLKIISKTEGFTTKWRKDSRKSTIPEDINSGTWFSENTLRRIAQSRAASRRKLEVFADELLAPITAWNAEEAELMFSVVMRRMLEWMIVHSLTLDLNKTERIFPTSKRMEITILLTVGSESLKPGSKLII